MYKFDNIDYDDNRYIMPSFPCYTLSLNEAIHLLYSVPVSSIRYKQVVDLRNIYADIAFSMYLDYRPEHETLHIRFPKECVAVSRIQNNGSCKMVYDHKDKSYIEITPRTIIPVDSTTTMIVYLRSKEDLQISFELILQKPSVLRSKL